jgi:hypothetical protein
VSNKLGTQGVYMPHGVDHVFLTVFLVEEQYTRVRVI